MPTAGHLINLYRRSLASRHHHQHRADLPGSCEMSLPCPPQVGPSPEPGMVFSNQYPPPHAQLATGHLCP
ncbi:uncharacterized protein BDZ83DRAFT_609557 [Colletotrichum acutatum]|uniref:Uncharacterized protein n=1 Tax=Glomerella acutata TaxID=27357 RepID=A0AAD8XIS2_GLOAC|nr:uncharacterized protein BDZ83DRAFT_609557 [Colletotrichum acutatum]KAK1728221.1 hypothetical protein BDZ83DRAFT_609557 [Colletotrichum acutatum]